MAIDQNRALVKKYRERSCNVVIFNYRGVGDSSGSTTREGIVQDGVAIVDFLHCAHQVPYSNIAVHGYSFGGGPSSQVAARRPGIAAVNERSYSKLSKAIPHFVRLFLPGIFNFAQFAGKASAKVIQATGWEFDTHANWLKILGKKCVVYAPNDEIIEEKASLTTAIREQSHIVSTKVIAYSVPQGELPHGALLNDRVVDEINQTIFPQSWFVRIKSKIRRVFWGISSCLKRMYYRGSNGKV